MNPMLVRKTLMATSVALALGAPAAHAALVTNVSGVGAMSTDSVNFTWLDPSGYVIWGTNTVNMLWDGNAFNSSTDYIGPGSVANVTLSSTSIFFGNRWFAHDIQVFQPGTYSFDTSLGGGNPESGIMTMNVGAGQLGMHMLWDWGPNKDNNVDMAFVWNANSVFGAGIGNTANPDCNSGAGQSLANCLYDGPGYGSAGMPNAAAPWMLASSDSDGDGVMGIPMAAGGLLPLSNPNINANMTAVVPAVVPVPAATWLFGSSLPALLAFARRRKRA